MVNISLYELRARTDRRGHCEERGEDALSTRQVHSGEASGLRRYFRVAPGADAQARDDG
jgi:hypothetical protein